MAMRTCEVCGTRFMAGVGKPPRTCPEHRGVKLPPRNKQGIRQEDAPKINQGTQAIDSLPNEGGYRQEAMDARHNRFDGRCHLCGLNVEADTGRIWKVQEDQPSKAFHIGCLSTHIATSKDYGYQAPKPINGDQESLIKTMREGEATEAIKTLLATLAPSIDEAGVRAIVNSAIADATSEDRIKSLIRAAGVLKHEIVIDGRDIPMPDVHHYLLPEVIKVLSAGLHLFLPGPAGSGKSTLAMQAAEILALSFHSISFGPTTPTSKLFGFVDANGVCHTTEFRKAYECCCNDDQYDYAKCECGGIFLGDEIDNGHPGLVAELNQALANPYCAFADRMVRKGRNFRMVVTGNTFGRGPDRLFVGRNILDAATLDRFATMEVPIDEAMETKVAGAYAIGTYADLVTRWIGYVQQVRTKVTDNKFQFVVSPRATIDGAKLLQAGMSWETVCDIRLFAGMSADTRKVVA